MSVRNVACVVVALVSISGTAQGQMTGGIRTVSFGIMAGANFAKLGGDDVEDASNRTGLLAGVYVDLPVANGVSVRPELLYSMQGAKTVNIDGKGPDAVLKLDYVQLPVLVRFTVPTASQTRPFIAVGPSFGLKTKCEVAASAGGVSGSVSCDDVDINEKSFDVGGKIEGGVDFGMNGRVLTIGGAYTHGFSDVVEDASVKNRVISLFAASGF
jgi:hypothetical protein